MPITDPPSFQRGERLPTAAKLQQLSDAIRESAPSGGCGNSAQGGWGFASAVPEDQWFWAKVTGHSGSPPQHSFVTMIESSPTDGTLEEDVQGVVGIIGDQPLYEVNGHAIPTDTIVRACRGAGDWYLCEIGSRGSGADTAADNAFTGNNEFTGNVTVDGSSKSLTIGPSVTLVQQGGPVSITNDQTTTITAGKTVTVTGGSWSFSAIVLAFLSACTVNVSAAFNFLAVAVVNFYAATYNLLQSMTWTLSSSVVWTITGGAKILFSTPIEVCGWWYWCWTAETWTGDKTDYSFSASKPLIRVTPSASGWKLKSAVPIADGHRITLVNASPTYSFTVSHENTSGTTAAYRILTPTAADWIVAPYESVDLWYDGDSDRWRLMAKDPDLTIGGTTLSGGSSGYLLYDNAGAVGELPLDTDGTLSSNSDARVATQKAAKTYADTKLPSSYLDTDGTLAANSDAKVASQKATKTYIDNAVTGLFDFKGSTDCSGNPNYPSASKGDAYVVSVAGKIGGASGTSVDAGDVYVASADNAGGTQAGVGASWFILEHNLAGALLSANNLSDLASASTARTNLGLGALATLATVGTSQIDADAVTYAKIQNVSATDKLLGRSTAGSGDVEEIACTSAGRALIDDSDASAQRTTLGLGTMATQDASSVAITGGSISGVTGVALGGVATNTTTTGTTLQVLSGNASASVASGKTYLVQGWFNLTGTPTGGSKVYVSAPASTTMDLKMFGEATNSTTVKFDAYTVAGNASVLTWSTGANPDRIFFLGYITTTNSGTVALGISSVNSGQITTCSVALLAVTLLG